MEREVLENAFAQALDELNNIKKSISEQNQLIKKLTEKMEGFDEKPEQQKVRVPSVDMQPFWSYDDKVYCAAAGNSYVAAQKHRQTIQNIIISGTKCREILSTGIWPTFILDDDFSFGNISFCVEQTLY